MKSSKMFGPLESAPHHRRAVSPERWCDASQGSVRASAGRRRRTRQDVHVVSGPHRGGEKRRDRENAAHELHKPRSLAGWRLGACRQRSCRSRRMANGRIDGVEDVGDGVPCTQRCALATDACSIRRGAPAPTAATGRRLAQLVARVASLAISPRLRRPTPISDTPSHLSRPPCLCERLGSAPASPTRSDDRAGSARAPVRPPRRTVVHEGRALGAALYLGSDAVSPKPTTCLALYSYARRASTGSGKKLMSLTDAACGRRADITSACSPT